MQRRWYLVLGGGLLGTLGLYMIFRDPSAADPADVTLFASRLGSDTRIPMRLRRWSSEVAAAALRWVKIVPAWTADDFARLLFGILERESQGGDTLWPDKTGDHTARVGPYLSRSDVRILDALPQGWQAPRDRYGRTIPAPWAIPADGLGWGRGLAQIDFGAHGFARSGDWRDPLENLDYAGRVLARAAKYWTGRERGWPLEALAVASYNAGTGGVKRALDEGRSPDSATTGLDYSTDVLANAREFGAAVA